MADISGMIERLVAAGCDPVVAACVVAEAVVAGKDSAPFRDDVPQRSKAAIRQKNYRERNAGVTKRNENVTERNAAEQGQSVTERNESVTNRNENVTRYDASFSLIEKKEEKKRERRGTQIPDGWRPDEQRWADACKRFGNDGAARELRKFTNHALANGRICKKWDAAWDNWIERAVEWGPKPASPPTIVAPLDRNWDVAAKCWAKFRTWPKGYGPDPDSQGCQCPREIIQKHLGGRHEPAAPTQETALQSRA